MKRSSTSSRGSLQLSGALKPRNEVFTPNNRESSGRKSYLPKLGQSGSAKRTIGRTRPSSTENLMRLSSTSARYQANNFSTDSGRGSGIGTSTRKDTRYATDPSFKTQYINKIFEFLKSNGLSPFQRRTLLTPTRKDFIDIFTFIFKYLDPSFTMPNNFEEEIPKLLKKLMCPITIDKSSFIKVGSPHTWPSVLAVLAYLVDLIHCNIINQDEADFLGDGESEDDDGALREFHILVDLFKCKNNEESEACREAYFEKLKSEYGASEKDLMDLEVEEEDFERSLEYLPVVADEVMQLKHCIAQYDEDLAKMNDYLQKLDLTVENKDALKHETKQILEKLGGEEMQIRKEVKDLKILQSQQGYSIGDVIHLKRRAREVGQEIEHQELLGKELISRSWEMEMELSNAQSNKRKFLVQFETLLEKVGVKPSFSDLDITSEDHLESVMDKIMTLKKTAKKGTSQAQENLLQADENIERAEGLLQEKMSECRMLDTKMRHIKEEHSITKEEITREEQLRLQETELLSQKIIESRKRNQTSTYPLHQVHEMMNNTKQELDTYKRKEEICLQDGAQFMKKILQERQRSVEARKKIVQEFTGGINAECDKFLEWFDLQVKTE